MNNIEIREAIKESGFKHWQIADIIGVADTTFCRMLRRELPESKKQEDSNGDTESKRENIAMNDSTFKGVLSWVKG